LLFVDSISCVSNLTCEAVGEDSSGSAGAIGTTDGGVTWSVQSLPSGSGQLLGVSCTSTSLCEAVGVGSTSGTGNVVGTTNGGATWSTQAIPSGVGGLASISCASSTSCEAVGEESTGFAAIIGTHDGGSTWASESVPSAAVDLAGVSCSSVSACVAVEGGAGTDLDEILIGPASSSPAVTSFAPAVGPVGTTVTIKGTNLNGATKVTFNGVKGTITSDTATKLKVKVPIGATTGKIKVVTPSGQVKTATAFTVT
jgi:hypothetical protein